MLQLGLCENMLIKIILLCRTVDVIHAATTASPPGTLCYVIISTVHFLSTTCITSLSLTNVCYVLFDSAIRCHKNFGENNTNSRRNDLVLRKYGKKSQQITAQTVG